MICRSRILAGTALALLLMAFTSEGLQAEEKGLSCRKVMSEVVLDNLPPLDFTKKLEGASQQDKEAVLAEVDRVRLSIANYKLSPEDLLRFEAGILSLYESYYQDFQKEKDSLKESLIAHQYLKSKLKLVEWLSAKAKRNEQKDSAKVARGGSWSIDEKNQDSAGELEIRKAVEIYITNFIDLLQYIGSYRNLNEQKKGLKPAPRKTISQQKIQKDFRFHLVRAGAYLMGEGEGKKPVTLDYDIEAMSIPVIQRHWVELMGENPSSFQEGEHSIVVDLNGKPIKMQPDNPVEMITWWSVIVFANRLSEKAGIKPAYDLSEIEWVEGTSAEAGTLDAKSGEIKIIANGGVHDPYEGDIYYQAEGYRLPTEAEQEYMLRAGGTEDGDYPFGNSKDQMKSIAWYDEGIYGRTHPVAQLIPLNVDGNDFYDLHGNVSEWGWDWYDDLLIGGDNPVGPKSGSYRVFRGGSWFSGASDLRSGCRPGNRTVDGGFRLVRTASKP